MSHLSKTKRSNNECSTISGAPHGTYAKSSKGVRRNLKHRL
jgi:hypothetical protein